MNQENNTFFVGKVLKKFTELDSTNQQALHLLATSKPIEGTTICAAIQKAGRGQQNSPWESAPFQNLTLSIILYPKFLLARQQFLFNQAIALGVYDCVSSYIDARVTVKWSNDVYIFHKKIAGLLIQNTLSGTSIRSSVVGIGLNVNQTNFLSDAPNPTSFALEENATFSLNDIQQSLFFHIEKWYLQLRAGQHERIKQTYLNRLYLYQKKAFFRDANNQKFEGTIVGIDTIGKLLVLVNGTTKAFGFKEIKFLLP